MKKMIEKITFTNGLSDYIESETGHKLNFICNEYGLNIEKYTDYLKAVAIHKEKNKPETIETKVQRYGDLKISLSNKYERYQVYIYKGKFYEIEKKDGEVISFSKLNHKPNTYDVLISSMYNEVR